jgi:NAD+ kinase
MRVLLVPNPANQRSVDVARRMADRLVALGYEPVLGADDAVACGLEPHGVPRSKIGHPELAMALGGDGTILKAVHLLGPSDVPVLGVNLGRLGFLAGADGDAVDEVLEAALAGEARVEMRQTIEATVVAGGRGAGRYRALNEVFIGREANARVVEFEVHINGAKVARYLCDGIIVATPTGSTAYALSAGGPLVSPDVRGILVVPVAPHTLTHRPILAGPSDVVRIACPNALRAEAAVVVDGDRVPCRTALDSVEIVTGEHDVRLLKLDGHDFFGVLAQTFLGG